MRNYEDDDLNDSDRRIAKGAGWAIVAICAVVIIGLGYWKFASSGCDGIDGLLTVCAGKGGIVISK